MNPPPRRSLRHRFPLPARRMLFRQLPWWLAGLAFTALGVMATAAWRDADSQRRDAEGAWRQLAAEVASQAALRLQSGTTDRRTPPAADTAGSGLAAEIPLVARQEWFRQGGAAEDWVFGPWPQPETPASQAFEEARSLWHAGRRQEADSVLGAGFPNLLTHGNDVEGFTVSGLPLKPLLLRLKLLTAASQEENPAADPAERAMVAEQLLRSSLTFPSILTPLLIGEAAAVLEKGADPGVGSRISEARQYAADLERLREILRQEVRSIHDGARWVGGDTWHLERREDGEVVILPLTEWSRRAAEAGIGIHPERRDAPVASVNPGVTPTPTSMPPPSPDGSSRLAGLPPGWELRARLDGVDVQSSPPGPETVMASVSSGPWRIDAVCRDAATAFAGLDRQRTRQRRLIGGTVGLLAAALTGFLWVLLRQRRLNTMMSNFVAAVSHELRAPVASVGLLSERLNSGKVQGAAEQTKYHRLIEGETRRISATIENVLAFSRMERHRLEQEFEWSDVRALVEDAIGLFQAPAAERRVLLETRTPPEPVELEINPVSVRQAVINLLDNALKFSPPGGRILIRLVSDPGGKNGKTGTAAGAVVADAVSIIIRDQGPGVPVLETRRIFDAFYRPGTELRRGTPGIGLGLAIVRETARAHGGEVSVRNPPGPDGNSAGGAEFTLRLVSQSLAAD